MKRRPTFLILLALMLFVPLIFAQVSQQQQPVNKPAVPDPAAQAVSEFQTTGVIREISYPADQTLSQLGTLLEPVGITVEQSLLENAERVRSFYDVLIKWNARPAGPKLVEPDNDNLFGGSMIIKESKRHTGMMERSPLLSLSTEIIFVTAVDAQSRLRWWQVHQNPLIFRAEYAEPGTGKMRSGGEFHVSETAFIATYPDGQEVTELRFFIPKWAGNGYVLRPLTTVAVTASQLQ